MARDGAQMAVEEWNAKGGVIGKTIVPLIEDSQCTPDPAISAALTLIDQQKVRFLIGEICSKASIPVSEIANSRKVIQIAIASTNPGVTVTRDGRVKDYVYRACFIDPFQGTVAAKFARDSLRAKTAFIMLDPANDYVKGLADYFERGFTAGGGMIVGKATYTSRDYDFSAILANVAAVRPDIIYFPDYYNVVNLAARQAKELGIRARFIGGDGWDSSHLDLKAVDGGFFTNHYSPQNPGPEVQNFVRAFGVKYGKVPDALAALAYDATNLMLTAIKDAGTDDTARVKDALNRIKFNGVSGRLTFDQFHNPVKSSTILAIRDGRIEFNSVVDPVEEAKPFAYQPQVTQEPKPVRVENLNPPAQPPSIPEIDGQAIALWNQKRYSEAIPLFNQACSGGKADSCNRLGLMYDFGQGVTQDFSRAAAFYSKSCNAGNGAACYHLSMLQQYQPGGAVCNSVAVTRNLSRSCDTGIATSCSIVGYSYIHGCGVAKDTEKGLQLLSKGCSLGDHNACDGIN